MINEKLILLFWLGCMMLFAAPVSARVICEGSTPPQGWERGSPLITIQKCPTGKGYQIRKIRDSRAPTPHKTVSAKKAVPPGKKKKKEKQIK